MLTAGFGGSITMLVIVGFTKKPRQLMARAKLMRAPKALIRRRFDFGEDMFFTTPTGRPRAWSGPFQLFRIQIL